MPDMNQGLAEYRRKLEAGEVQRSETRTPWERLRERPSPKRMIAAKCHECMGWAEGGERPPGIRSDIRDCTAAGCPLFAARPYRGQA